MVKLTPTEGQKVLPEVLMLLRPKLVPKHILNHPTTTSKVQKTGPFDLENGQNYPPL